MKFEQHHQVCANHGTYTNPGTQVEAQIKDFGTGSQKDCLGANWVNFCWVCVAGLSEPLTHCSLLFGRLKTIPISVTFGQI